MKNAINLEGKKVSVSDSITVRTSDGIHYLLSPEEDQVEIDKEVTHLAKREDYLLNHKFKDDRKKAYGTWEEQMERLYKDQKNGTSTFKDHQDMVRGTIKDPSTITSEVPEG